MKTISKIVIMNYWKRKGEGQYLKKLIEVSARPYGIPVEIAYDDGSLGVWKNYAQALTLGGNEDGGYRMVIQDDMTFDRNILEKILYILQYAPDDKILMFYNPTNKDYITCYEEGRHVLETSQNFWLQCGLYPESFIGDFVATMEEQAKPERGDDDRLSAYLQKKRMSLYSVVPSLLQHLGAYRSTFIMGGVAGGVERNSSTCDTQFNVTSVDWVREFANPYKTKINKDYTKEVFKEEYQNA